ncbi:MAG: tripartite tricarboxylate transporter substrate binding protein [Methylibium sp.]|uniref:tripartite tricarboxylate transporter substrate binding protein n=1 Tax=Methylibium sp. TaxID=2067992 RepID=UPI001851288E|nr:tripartite tricarboxylate transporter substrate binding protein [Methylibium sp.]MBA3596165.1 tripartite tricarboxylate transporter substrate binding protein [Methylibium sp.]
MSRDRLTSHANSRRSLLLAGASMAGAAALPGMAWAQDKYPSRPIEFIVPWGAGGGADQVSRRIARLLEEDLGTSFPIINVPGATGNTGMSKLLNSPPDGYSMATFIGDTMGTLAGGGGRWKLDDIVPLGVIIRQPTGLFVKNDAKWKTFDDLLADSRKNELKVGITGFGSPDEIQVMQMNQKGSKFRLVPFAKPGERYASILGGHADVVVEQAGDLRSFLESNQMRPLVFFSDQPQRGHEKVALAKDHGFPIMISQFRSIVMRAGTDPKQVAVMAAAVEKAVRSDDFKNYLEDELAFADSFVPAAKTDAFFANELKLIESNLQKKS